MLTVPYSFLIEKCHLYITRFTEQITKVQKKGIPFHTNT